MAQTQVVNTTKIVEPLKERSNMVKARKDAHLSQKDVSQKMNVDIKSVNNWEKARTDPRHYQIDELREVIGFAGTDKELLQVFTVEESNQEPCHQEAVHDTMNSSDHPFVIYIPRSVKGFSEFMELFRRQFIEALAKITGVKLFDHVTLALVSSPTVEPEEYLALCSEGIETWWEWLNQGNYPRLERALLKHVPTLKRLANTISPFQGIAAGLVVEAKIMQIILATRNLDFVAREGYCAEAVRYGGISGNVRLYITALQWQGNTYVYCHRRPKKAVPIFNNALSHISDDTSLSKSGICSLLSIAYAQDNTQDNYETKARKNAELAQITMPKHPELDPSYKCLQFGQSEIDQQEGKMYLHLAEHFPNYAQIAYDAFEMSTNKQSLNSDYLSGSLIKKADAARALGYMDKCVEDLTEGFRIGDEIGSLRRLIEANDVMGRMPPEWGRERAVQELQKGITNAIQELQKVATHALVVARR